MPTQPTEPNVSICIEITGVEGTRDTVDAQVEAILDALLNRDNFGYKAAIRPCIYAAALDTPERWDVTAYPIDKRDDTVDRVRVFE